MNELETGPFDFYRAFWYCVGPMRNRLITYSTPVASILLLGPTGAGKSPLGDELGRQGFNGHRAHHLDFGAELRAAVSAGHEGDFTGDERRFIEGVLERGLLLENERFALAEKIIRLFLERNAFEQGHLLVLNGIPRHTGQARDLAGIADIQALVVLECAADDVLFRLQNNVAGDRSKRIDDDPVLVGKKLNVFRERTAPLIEFYEDQGRRIYRLGISGATTAHQAYARLSAMAASRPPAARL